MLFSPVWSLGGERFERNFLNLSIMPHSFLKIIRGNYRDFFQPRVVPRGGGQFSYSLDNATLVLENSKGKLARFF
jgi:hypothetical protein